MEQGRICDNCKVSLSGDLSNCPLCGKHVSNKNKKAQKNNNSYPLYDMKFVQTAKWYNIIRTLFWVVGIFSVIVNLMFETKPYWFPYVLAGLITVFHVVIEPIKTRKVSSYIKDLVVISVLVAIFLIFLDAYNYYTLGTSFGWALAYSAPLVMMAGAIASSLICLLTKMYEVELLRNITFLAVISIGYFLVKVFVFKDLANWPSLSFMCTAVGLVVVLELFKRNKLVKELSKEFHI